MVNYLSFESFCGLQKLGHESCYTMSIHYRPHLETQIHHLKYLYAFSRTRTDNRVTAKSPRTTTIGNHGCGATTKRLGSLGESLGISWTILELKTVATKLAGRYRVATEVKALEAFESLSRCSLNRVRILACSPNRPSVLDIAALVPFNWLLVRNSRILCNYQTR